MTTKEQERKALAQIQKIVDGLGENSYVAAAFEGCFEIAADNIENDFACNLLQRIEAAEREAGRLKQEVEKLEGLLDARTNMLKIAQGTVDDARKHAIPAWLWKSVWMHYDSAIENAEARRVQLADIMAGFADSPTDIAFQNAVKQYRKNTVEIEEFKRVVGGLERIKPDDV